MPGPSESLEARLLATFKIEAREHIQAMASALGSLEKAPSALERAGVIEVAFRSAHSLKGAARAVNVKDIESLCHSVESVFTTLKRRDSAPAPAPAFFDLLYQVLDALDALLRRLDPDQTSVEKPRITDLIRALESALLNPASIPIQAQKTAPPLPDEIASTSASPVVSQDPERLATPLTVRVAASKLDAMLLQAAELIPAGMAASQNSMRLRECGERFSAWKRSWTRIRPVVRSIDQNLDATREGPEDRHLSRLLEFVEWNEHFVEQMERQIAEMSRTADHDQRSLTSMVDHLLEETAKVAMQPFSMVLDLFPRFVRELARDQNKEIDLVIQGAELEIDRRILEEIKDPLIHLIRNSIDHGIELPAERTKLDKPLRGTITITVSAKDGATVELRVSDDGGGIDIERLKYAAVKEHLLSAERARALTDEEALQLVFQSGATTSPIITDISGRGLGLAIAREKVNNLNGEISVESYPDKGAVFRIVLPLTLARFRGVLVRAEQSLFVLPTAAVDQVIRLREDLVKSIENRETITISDQALSLVRLANVLALPKGDDSDESSLYSYPCAVILASGGERIAFGVDAVVDEQEILVKPLGPHLAGLRDFVGATVLGNGALALILSVPELMKRATQGGPTRIRRSAPDGALERPKAGFVLVVEDSITSRSLLKSILESAGYKVETAVDGIDAFTKARSGHFDVVVSDVDMPRMNGFGLTARLRADKHLADLPVILVTSLDSEKDREHGIDVGANAYIIKSSFDQTHLLDAVRRLV